MQRAITGTALITTRRTRKNGTVDRSCARNERFRPSDCSLRSRNTFLDCVNGCTTVSLHGNVLLIFVETCLNQSISSFTKNTLTLSLSLSLSLSFCLIHSLTVSTIFPRKVLIYYRPFHLFFLFSSFFVSINRLACLEKIRRLSIKIMFCFLVLKLWIVDACF